MSARPLERLATTASLDRLGLAAAVLGACLFSTKPIFIKLAYDVGAAPLQLLFWRMALALPVYLCIGFVTWRRRGRGRVGTGRWWLLAGLNGILGYYIASVLDFFGLVHITAQLERLILFTYPFWVVILGALFFGQKLKPLTFPALVVAYLGLALVFAGLVGHETVGGRIWLGALLVLLAAFAFALFQLFGPGIVRNLGAPLYTSIAMTAAAFGVMTHAVVVEGPQGLVVPADVLTLAAAIALFATVFPSYLMNYALGRIGADGTAMAGNAGPVFTIALGVVLLGEPFGLAEVLGTGLVILGVWLFTRR